MGVGVLFALNGALGRALAHQNRLFRLAEFFEVDALRFGGGKLPGVGKDVVHGLLRVAQFFDHARTSSESASDLQSALMRITITTTPAIGTKTGLTVSYQTQAA